VFQTVSGRREAYRGTITRIGIDIGVHGESVMSWTVIGSSVDFPAQALRGKYAGVSAEASVGLGVGANALLGGSRDSVVLQPLSVQVQVGLNIAAGVTGLELDYRD
jgi:hypothetical protein